MGSRSSRQEDGSEETASRHSNLPSVALSIGAMWWMTAFWMREIIFQARVGSPRLRRTEGKREGRPRRIIRQGCQ